MDNFLCWVSNHLGFQIAVTGGTILSTTEAEYIALSMSLRDVLPIMFLLKEIR
jgi:hypothetical protein